MSLCKLRRNGHFARQGTEKEGKRKMQTLQEMKECILKSNAFYWTSFDPSGRLNRYAEEFESEHNKIKRLCDNYQMDSEKFLKKHFGLTMNYLRSQSRCASSAITGPANFPTSRMEKRNKYAQNHLEKLLYFVNNIEKILARINRAKESEDDKIQRWENKICYLKERHQMMKDYNKGLIPYEKLPEDMKKHIDFMMKHYPNAKANFAGYKLTNNLAEIRRLENQVQLIKRARENKKEESYSFEGGHVSFDSEEIRYNIYFNDIPPVETRSKLKSNGFKWSPRRKAWTRGAKTISMERIKSILQ